MLKIGLFAQIARYLKDTPKILSGARNVIGTSNLDQRYLVGISSGVQRDFLKFWFFAPFLGAAG